LLILNRVKWPLVSCIQQFVCPSERCMNSLISRRGGYHLVEKEELASVIL